MSYRLLFFLWRKGIPLYICATLEDIHLSVIPTSLYDKIPGESKDAGAIHTQHNISDILRAHSQHYAKQEKSRHFHPNQEQDKDLYSFPSHLV